MGAKYTLNNNSTATNVAKKVTVPLAIGLAGAIMVYSSDVQAQPAPHPVPAAQSAPAPRAHQAPRARYPASRTPRCKNPATDLNPFESAVYNRVMACFRGSITQQVSHKCDAESNYPIIVRAMNGQTNWKPVVRSHHGNRESDYTRDVNRAGHYKAFKLEQLIGVAECAAKGELTAQEVLDIIQTQYAHAANQVPGRITIVYGMKGESPEDWQEVHVNRTSNFVPKPGAEVKEIMFTPDGNNRYPIDAKHRTSCSGKGRPKSQCYGKAVHGLVIEGEGVYMPLDVLVSAAKRVRDRLPAGATSNADADREDPSATGPAPAPTEPGKSESRGWGFYAGGGYAASLDDSLNFNLALVRAGVIIPTERINGKLHVRLGVLGLGGSGTEDENAAAPNPNDPAGTQGVSYLESTVAGGALEGGVSFNLDPIMLHVAAALGVGNHHSELYQELWANGSLVSNEPPIPQNQVNPIAALSAGIGFNICKYAGLDFEGIMVLAPNRHGKVTPAAGGMVNLRFNIPGISK